MRGVFTVTAMTGADLDEVAAIEAVSHPKPKGRASFESDLANDVARCFVLRGEGAVLGYLVVWVTDVVEIIDVAVAVDWRGRRLVDRLLAEALRLGPRVLLEVRAANISAIKVYARHGFERVGVRRGYYGDGEDAVLMARDGVGPEVGGAVRRERAALVRGLYPILSDDVLDVREFAAAAAMVAPRVSVMQLRFKESADGVALGVAREVVAALSGWPGLLVLNDRADLLRLVDPSDVGAPEGGHGGPPLQAGIRAAVGGGVRAAEGGHGGPPLQAGIRAAVGGGVRAAEGGHGGPALRVGRGLGGPFLGLHLGQSDLPLAVARPLMPGDAVLGYSTHDLEQLSAALASFDAVRPDYVAYGPVFATGTKKNPDPVVGLDGLAEARRRLDELAQAVPLVAIGGLDPERAALALQHADAVAVIGALFGGGLAGLERRLDLFTLGHGARA